MADAATWQARVAAWRASGKTAAVFCAGSGMSVSALRYWARRWPAESARTAMVRLARVVARPGSPAPAPALIVEVGVARIRVEPGFDRTTLAAIVDVLGGAR